MFALKLAGLTALVCTVGAQLHDCDPYPFDVTTIAAPDGSVTAKFVSIGATMAELWVKDRSGQPLDVIPGYDDPSRLLTDPGHPVFNAMVGRYANRIKDGTFSLPPSRNPPASGPNVYHIPTNSGHNTLHGGIVGWDRRNWTLVAKNQTSVTYHHLDAADEHFPGTVDVYVTHSVDNGQLRTQAHATATATTPIMVTQHIYWNLDGFRTNAPNVLKHTLHVDGSRYLKTDGTGIPTGDIVDVSGTALDFRTPTAIGARWAQTDGLCGPGCQGYDTCWIYDKPETQNAGVSLWSDFSGIRVDITTDQPATQVYTPSDLAVPRKAVHGGPGTTYGAHAAVAIEQEGWIAAINNPQWGIDQVYGPGKDFAWSATYRFSSFG